MSDKVAVLSKRPASIKSIYNIDLKISETRTPIINFKDYFNILWNSMKQNNVSQGLIQYLKSLKKEKNLIFFYQIFLLVGFINPGNTIASGK
ncbi:hypothetical protein [Paraclostridium sordellii]|uniref:hypothetical protein n=1 Tax=Paraclostridium sordellii TaxID=1505 RepID=UPI0030D129BD